MRLVSSADFFSKRLGSRSGSTSCQDPESFVRGDPTLSTFFFYIIDEGREDLSTIISGPSSARQQNAIKWRSAGGPMMAQH